MDAGLADRLLEENAKLRLELRYQIARAELLTGEADELRELLREVTAAIPRDAEKS